MTCMDMHADASTRRSDYIELSKQNIHELYYVKGLSVVETAEKLGVSASTVRRRMDENGMSRRSLSEAIRKPHVPIGYNGNGYLMWNESISGKNVKVHRLLAVAKYGFDAVCDMDVHHRNGIRFDNRPDNIELIEHGEHIRRHYEQGDISKPPNPWELGREK